MNAVSRLLAAAVFALLGGAAHAQWHGHGGGHGGWHGHGGPAWHGGWGGGPRGYVYGGLPHGSVSIGFGRGHYYYGGGRWYRPYGPRFAIVVPPIGIVAPFLPFGYTSVWVGGSPYYYANGAYYAPVSGGYAVVAPPVQSVAVAPQAVQAAPAAALDPIFYPRQGQTAARTEADRRACNQWASSQPNAMADASVFQRATLACMDGRGYTVK